MKYVPLYKVYYNDRDAYDALCESRINSKETVKLDIDVSGNEAFFVPCPQMFYLINDILRTDKKVALIRTALPPEAIDQFRIECLINEIIKTNDIEGVHSTRREIKDVIDSLGTSKRQEKRFEGLVNHYNLLGSQNIELSKCEDLRRLYDILVLDEVVANDSKNAPDGKFFRKEAAFVRDGLQQLIHTGITPEEKINEYIQKSLNILMDVNIDILIRAAIFHYLIGYIHPFYDGNGRLSRFISSFLLSKDLDPLLGNRLSYTIEENLSQYYKMFKTCNNPINKGDITPFIIMFLEIVLQAEENLLVALQKRQLLYEKGIEKIERLANSMEWDQWTKTISLKLLIATLFSGNGLSKKELLGKTGIKSTTTLNSKLKILKEVDLIHEKKGGYELYYKLKYEKLDEL